MYNKWSCEDTKKFVLEYVKHECLWKNFSPRFREKQACLDAYRSIARTMDLPNIGIPEVKNKIKNLRSTYKQEMKKTEESKFSQKPYRSNLKWLIDLAPVFNNNYKPRRKPAIQKNNIYDIAALQDRSKEDEGCEFQTKDESDIFGENVAMQLKKMSEEKALLAKCKIQTILTEYGIADLKERKPETAKGIINDSLLMNDIKIRISRANSESNSSMAENKESDPLDHNFILKCEEDSHELETLNKLHDNNDMML